MSNDTNMTIRNEKILIVEDDEKISNLVKLYLENDGYKTAIAMDGKEALSKFKSEKPDLIILDIMLPEIDGVEVARRIRSESKVPILILSAKSGIIDKVVGLEIGADDYVTKPFEPQEIVARVKAILRRTSDSAPPDKENVFKISDLEINRDKFLVFRDGDEIRLSVIEFTLLEVLASKPGHVLSRNQLMHRIYRDENEIVVDRTIDVHIKNLRKKLGDDSKNPKYIESVIGVGYKFREENET